VFVSKINITVDTEDDTIKCDVDGTDFPNVANVYICKYGYPDGECSVEICSAPMQVGDHVKQVIRICTAGKVNAQKDHVLSTSPDKTIAVVRSNDAVHEAFSKWLNKKN